MANQYLLGQVSWLMYEPDGTLMAEPTFATAFHQRWPCGERVERQQVRTLRPGLPCRKSPPCVRAGNDRAAPVAGSMQIALSNFIPANTPDSSHRIGGEGKPTLIKPPTR